MIDISQHFKVTRWHDGPLFRRRLILGTALLLGTLWTASSSGQALEVIAMEGDVTADGIISLVQRPSVSTGGVVVFPASIDIGAFDDPDAILRYRSGTLTRIALQTQVVAGSYELRSLTNVTLPAVNASGDVLFVADFFPVGGGGTDNGIFFSDGATGTLAPVVVEGDPTADGNGSLFVATNNHPALNEAGQVAFTAEIFGAVGGLGNGSGIYRWNGAAVTRIVRTGQTPPGGADPFDVFTWPSLNSVGQVAFLGIENGTPAVEGIYRGAGGALTKIAREGETPFMDWEIRDFTPVSGVPINNHGQVAFRARIVDPNVHAVFVGDGNSTTLVAHSFQPLREGTDLLPSAISRNLAINDRGQVAFMAGSSRSGVFRADASELVAIALDGDLVPGTIANTFVLISGFDFAINQSGDVAFLARIDDGAQFVDALFLYTDDGVLAEVVRPGTPLAGGVVGSIGFAGTNPSDFRSREPSGLDDDGNVVFRFRLVDGRTGIAIRRSTRIFADGFESGNTSSWSAASP